MKLRRVALVLTISLAMVLTSFSVAFGCTSLFVGKDISENGSRYISRTEDMSDNYCKIFGIREAADHPDGEMYEDTYGFSMPYPAHTLKYSYIRDSEGYGETVMDENGNPVGEAYAAAGQNELGVSMTATVSTSMNLTARSADPLNSRTGL
jgi:dipeptidase